MNNATQDPPSDTHRQARSLALLVDIFTAPGSAFAALWWQPRRWLPLLLLMVSSGAVNAGYLLWVDYGWYVDDVVRRGAFDPARADAVRSALSSQSATVMAVSTALGSSFAMGLLVCLQAGYLSVWSALRGDGIRFGQWVALAAWTALPHLWVSLTLAINMALTPSHQLSLFDANALSLRNLGLNPELTGLPSALVDQVNLALLWSVALLTAGYRQWTHCGWSFSAAVILTPQVLLLVLGIAFAPG